MKKISIIGDGFFGMYLSEYFALPAIGGIYEYAINDINSLIVDTKPDSELNIIHAINDLINNISKVDKMKNNGLSTANNYSIESAAKSEIDLLISIKEVGNEK